MKASIVIGANYGDEGKGLVTDYLAAKARSLVVRFNGGAQAGHTVTASNGQRHVFHHFGAGSYAGSGTYLSQFFVTNPMTFVKEYGELVTKSVVPMTYIDTRCLVTTPYDLMLNQAVEASRGSSRHGSCGLGINETQQRSKFFRYRLTAWELQYPYILNVRLNHIRDEYVPLRLKALGLPADALEHLHNDKIRERFDVDCARMISIGHLATPRNFDYNYEDIVFEGAQGLLLDMDSHNFPHVTHSKTGIKNAVVVAKEMGIEGAEVYYVSRTYLTRHGNGLLPNEWPFTPPGLIDVDSTNVTNEHQGHLRYAPLNPLSLIQRIREDMLATSDFDLTPFFVLTCADQTKDVVEGLVPATSMDVEEFAGNVSRMIGAKGYLVSRGPARNDIKETHL